MIMYIHLSESTHNGDSSAMAGTTSVAQQPDSNVNDAHSSTATTSNSTTLMSTTDNNVSSSSKSTPHFAVKTDQSYGAPDFDTDKCMEILLGCVS